jgi:hypothetical protein
MHFVFQSAFSRLQANNSMVIYITKVELSLACQQCEIVIASVSAAIKFSAIVFMQPSHSISLKASFCVQRNPVKTNLSTSDMEDLFRKLVF